MILFAQTFVQSWDEKIPLLKLESILESVDTTEYIINKHYIKLDSNPEPLSSETNTQPFGQTGQMIELCSEYLSVWCI